MSSYINSAEHFNSIETKLHRLLLDNNFRGWSTLKDIAPNIYKHWTNRCLGKGDEAEITAIIDTLREIQVLCVSLQYKHHYEGTLDTEIETERQAVKVRTAVTNLSLHGLCNALECVNYQIEIKHLKELRELTIEEENALKFIDKITEAIVRQIVAELPDDRTCTWSL